MTQKTPINAQKFFAFTNLILSPFYRLLDIFERKKNAKIKAKYPSWVFHEKDAGF